MSERPADGHAERVNDELRGYEGFAAILSMLQQTADASGAHSTVGTVAAEKLGEQSRQAPDEDLHRDDAYRALIALPEMADIVGRLEDLDAKRRARALTGLFGWSDSKNS